MTVRGRNPEGVVAAETANNACMPGALAPMLALGIPGKASIAVLIGALAIHGVQPAPLIFQKNPEIPYVVYLLARTRAAGLLR